MSTLFVVDGPNLYNRVSEHLVREKRSALGDDVNRAYFREWFDVDRLVLATVGGLGRDPWKNLGVVVFRSNKAMGAHTARIDQKDLLDYWTRQGTNPNTSVMVVDIPGGPRGRKKKKNVEADEAVDVPPDEDDDDRGGEKGVDMSMAVYLFETIDSWDTAVLFTDDTDFVPAVWSLRRKGKRVHCVARDKDRTSPLAVACQDFKPLSLSFLELDRRLFELLQPGGLIARFVEEYVLADGMRGVAPTIYANGGALYIRSVPSPSIGLSVLTNMADSMGLREGSGTMTFRDNNEVVIDFDNGFVTEGFARHYASEYFASAAWRRWASLRA